METWVGNQTILTIPQIHKWKVHSAFSLSPLSLQCWYLSCFSSQYLCLLLFGFEQKHYIFSLLYFVFSISIVLIECVGLSFKLFFVCLLAYHVQLSMRPHEQWINQILMKIKIWKAPTAMYKLYTHLTTFPHDQF